jgi:DNA-binding IclR family transcriptional regulator
MHRLNNLEIRTAILVVKELREIKRPLRLKELSEVVPMSKTTVSKHIKKLEHCRIVTRLSRNGGLVLGEKADDYMRYWLLSWPIDSTID